MVEFTFSIVHGNNSKGSKLMMPKSTAEALEAHKIGRITKGEVKAPVVEEDEE